MAARMSFLAECQCERDPMYVAYGLAHKQEYPSSIAIARDIKLTAMRAVVEISNVEGWSIGSQDVVCNLLVEVLPVKELRHLVFEFVKVEFWITINTPYDEIIVKSPGALTSAQICNLLGEMKFFPPELADKKMATSFALNLSPSDIYGSNCELWKATRYYVANLRPIKTILRWLNIKLPQPPPIHQWITFNQSLSIHVRTGSLLSLSVQSRLPSKCYIGAQIDFE